MATTRRLSESRITLNIRSVPMFPEPMMATPTVMLVLLRERGWTG
jgi:hypothetical protein